MNCIFCFRKVRRYFSKHDKSQRITKTNILNLFLLLKLFYHENYYSIWYKKEYAL